jgi:hypothetical protein
MGSTRHRPRVVRPRRRLHRPSRHQPLQLPARIRLGPDRCAGLQGEPDRLRSSPYGRDARRVLSCVTTARTSRTEVGAEGPSMSGDSSRRGSRARAPTHPLRVRFLVDANDSPRLAELVLAFRRLTRPSFILIRSSDPVSPDEQAAMLPANLGVIRDDLATGAIVVFARGVCEPGASPIAGRQPLTLSTRAAPREAWGSGRGSRRLHRRWRDS